MLASLLSVCVRVIDEVLQRTQQRAPDGHEGQTQDP
jgi:hypothetical protein